MTNKYPSKISKMMLVKVLLIVSLLYSQVSGALVIVAKSTSPFVNEEAHLLPTLLLHPQFLLKVAAHPGGKNLTPRFEITFSL